MTGKQRLIRWCAMLTVTFLVTACATTAPGVGSDPRDPYENYNRSMFTFNKTIDDNVLKPVATGYVNVVPAVVREAIGNFFANIGDVWTAANNYMQGKPKDGTTDLVRVIFNSTIGIAGLIDVATPMGLPKHEEDFGQTLGVWGAKSGPYFVLPLFGPSTVRDALAKPVDLYADPLTASNDVPVRAKNTGRALRLVDDRAAVLDSTAILEGAALDPYQFFRDAYLQRRESRVRDGKD
ncbi:MAG: VacJ family lipoprotein [Oxalobacteraceae bacterium]|jgi:phospholipid-binding lipoprotein MlaA|nr:VacJ family lipoprotein [Oxalobacteraceae bacterium]